MTFFLHLVNRLEWLHFHFHLSLNIFSYSFFLYSFFCFYFTGHGSLTIVRRSNSRKNFTQISDTQQTSIATTPLSASTSPSAATFLSNQQATTAFTSQQNIPTTSCSSSPQFLITPIPDDFSSNSATATTIASSTTIKQYDNRSKNLTSEAIKLTNNKTAQAILAAQQQQQPPLFTGTNPAGFTATAIASAITTTTTNTIAMQPTSPNATNFRPTSEHEHESPDGSNDSLTDPSTVPALQLDLATENLPAVDTPDACDKAALR